MKVQSFRPAWASNARPPAESSQLAERINKQYDALMYAEGIDAYYDHSGFHNFGYWTPQTRSQREASENLVDLLVRLFPRKSGTVLDVACGMGASTKRLLLDFDPANVTGINISDKQLATCRQRAPGCRFLNMDATRLRFADNSFDNILCVEAAFHFNTREDFLREAFRVLKPGGGLALSDVLCRSWPAALAVAKRIPLANFVPDVEQYRALYDRVGFEDVRIIEALAQCWQGFRDHAFATSRAKVLKGEAPISVLRIVALGQRLMSWAFGNYLIVGARKPHSGFARGGWK